jgi:subtilisin family serine protease
LTKYAEIIFILLFLICFNITEAQVFNYSKFWITFKNKNNSSFNLNNPEEFLSEKAIQRRIKQNIIIDTTDIPINQSYVDFIESSGGVVLNKSKWLNAITIYLEDTSVLQTIRQFSFVKNIEPVFGTKIQQVENTTAIVRVENTTMANSKYGNSFNQISMLRGDYLHQKEYQGEGMLIGVFDSGFRNVNEIPAFNKLFSENRILHTWDYVTGEENVYDDDNHGTSVLSTMAAYVENEIIGTAPNAKYILFRTEDAPQEFRIEEDNWVAAAEFADSMGVDIINSSLGYSNFDDPSMSYSYEDMNGKTTRITIAANIASKKGIIVVNSAGNSGNRPWKFITAPADAYNILAVGAVNDVGNVTSFSSRGPSADGRVKPDVMAKGNAATIVHQTGEVRTASGTSFSSPILAGLVACLWQAFPEKSSNEIMQMVRQSGHLYFSPNDSMGYGIPDFKKAFLLNNNEFQKLALVAYPNPFSTSFNISFMAPEESTYSIALYDYFGKEIYTSAYLMNKGVLAEVNLENTALLPNGVYIVRITSTYINETIRVVKF